MLPLGRYCADIASDVATLFRSSPQVSTAIALEVHSHGWKYSKHSRKHCTYRYLLNLHVLVPMRQPLVTCLSPLPQGVDIVDMPGGDDELVLFDQEGY